MTGQAQPPRSGSGPAAGGAPPVALIGAAAMLLVELVLLLLTLVEAPNHLSYLTNLFGIGNNWFPSPLEFAPGDVATVAVLVAGIMGCQGGRAWGRPVILATMGLTVYPAATSLLSELTSGDGRAAFTQGHYLWFNLILILELLISAGTVVVGLATASRGGASAPAPGQPFPQQPPQGQPFPQQPPAPGYAPPPAQPGYPAQSLVPPPVSYQPPSPDIRIGQQPGPGYAQPPVPPQGGPAQQGRPPLNPPGA